MTPVLLALLEDALKYDVLKIKIPAKIHIVDSEMSMYPYDVSPHLKPEKCTRIDVTESADGIEFSLRLALLPLYICHYTTILMNYLSVRITGSSYGNSWCRRSDPRLSRRSPHWRK